MFGSSGFTHVIFRSLILFHLLFWKSKMLPNYLMRFTLIISIANFSRYVLIFLLFWQTVKDCAPQSLRLTTKPGSNQKDLKVFLRLGLHRHIDSLFLWEWIRFQNLEGSVVHRHDWGNVYEPKCGHSYHTAHNWGPNHDCLGLVLFGFFGGGGGSLGGVGGGMGAFLFGWLFC